MSMKNQILPEFQNYLRSNSLAHEKYIPFYAHWARNFLDFSKNNSNLSYDLQIQKFLDFLKAQKNINDWQVKQANNAITLYINKFLDRNESTSFTGAQTLSDSSEITEQMREALRIKHYAYRTELVYLDWVKKFHAYLRNVKKKELNINLASSDVRDFLSHLALKSAVSYQRSPLS
jgi:hypothetical protein